MPESDFTTRPVVPDDIEAWSALRKNLWPAHKHHTHDLSNYFRHPDSDHMAFLVASRSALEIPVGFIEMSLRHTSLHSQEARTASIEGWFVSEFIRHAGAGKALLMAAETWARDQGCVELWSECDINNLTSASAHRSCGFQETRRSISFRKSIATSL